MKKLDRRTFVVSSTTVAAALSASRIIAAAQSPAAGVVGPMVGHVDSHQAWLWLRAGAEGDYVIKLFKDGREIASQLATPSPEQDYCMAWHFAELEPNTRYEYQIWVNESDNVPALAGEDFFFKTPLEPGKPTKTALAFGSCAKTEPLKLWTQMADSDIEGLVLLGDAPYIDSTDLEVQRRKHREFLRIPELASLIRSRPVWGTWDDHDFGKNDSDGRLKGKENSRKAFLEYRAHQSKGEDGQGIYTSLRRGSIELFLLDTRWFARTGPSPVAADKPTLLGNAQWEWLLRGLKNSDATFKIIACGMIWDDKENTESDDWGTYTHERTALFDFIGRENISGVLLIGGDIHCSRLLKYKTESQVGYPLHQCIVSPIHSSTIPSLNVAHPDLIRGEATPHVWLRLECDSSSSPATLTAQWVQMNGKEMWTLKLSENEMGRS